MVVLLAPSATLPVDCELSLVPCSEWRVRTRVFRRGPWEPARRASRFEEAVPCVVTLGVGGTCR